MTNTSQYPVTIDVWLLRYKYLMKNIYIFEKLTNYLSEVYATVLKDYQLNTQIIIEVHNLQLTMSYKIIVINSTIINQIL